ncbi:predicted protein [Lichtheimia corymbifera JMRC:FSU:9682]|uniref:60S ribosomal protein L29 n=1 Tax=Lichtheimia corymbifera JMRC:FSU:9682 TaxID=1263082 RepID=A0A068RTY1_9FUNG|nr:predicted protein [Lichtheimia corymbifera JMRC:FSU:9682]
MKWMIVKWPSRRTTPTTTKTARLTVTVSRSPSSTATPPSRVDAKFLRNQRYAKKGTLKALAAKKTAKSA